MKLALVVLLALGGRSLAQADELVYTCDAAMNLKGKLRVDVDPTTLRGRIHRYTAGKALVRDLHVTAVRDGSVLELRFDRYGKSDHTTIRGVRKPRPRGEKLVRGKSVVARLETTAPGVARLHVDGAVDWTTDSGLVVDGGTTSCR